MVAGVHTLVTGLNGHGKTLYTVAEKLRPLVGSEIEHAGQQIKRRLVVGGIKDLLLEHELMHVPKVDPESWKDDWRDKVREPGDPPLEVEYSAVNWWCWCMPGDVIVIDECQRLFRPMASGRRVPMFIEKLETARHYGVQFVYITQHPMLLHSNVRQLVGPHEHVRRIYGASRTVVYQWDTATNPQQVKNATKRFWKHDKAAFGLYKSAEVHTNFAQKLPLAVWGLLLGIAALVAIGFVLKGRMDQRFSEPTPAKAAPGAQPNSQPGSPAKYQAGAALPAAWPVLNVSAGDDGEPFSDRGLHLAGCYGPADRPSCLFTISVDGAPRATVTEAQLLQVGYSWRYVAPCSGVMYWRESRRRVTCDTPAAAAPATPASSPPPGAAHA